MKLTEEERRVKHKQPFAPPSKRGGWKQLLPQCVISSVLRSRTTSQSPTRSKHSGFIPKTNTNQHKHTRPLLRLQLPAALPAACSPTLGCQLPPPPSLSLFQKTEIFLVLLYVLCVTLLFCFLLFLFRAEKATPGEDRGEWSCSHTALLCLLRWIYAQRLSSSTLALVFSALLHCLLLFLLPTIFFPALLLSLTLSLCLSLLSSPSCQSQYRPTQPSCAQTKGFQERMKNRWSLFCAIPTPLFEHIFKDVYEWASNARQSRQDHVLSETFRCEFLLSHA